MAKSKTPLLPTDPRHGIYAGYIAGCREECCRAANRARQAWVKQNPQPRLRPIGITVERAVEIAVDVYGRISPERQGEWARRTMGRQYAW